MSNSIHDRTNAAFLADAAKRADYAATQPRDDAECDAAIAAIEAGLIEGGAIEPARVYVETRTLAGDVVRRHGPFARTSAEFSNAYHAEECAALGHNRKRLHDDASCQRVHIVPAPRMVPQQVQQQQACAAAFAEQLEAAPVCVDPNRLNRQDCEALAPGRRVQHRRHNWAGNTWRRLTIVEAGAIRATHDITGTAENGPGIARELVCAATTHDEAGRVLTRETVRFQVYAS